MTNSMTKKRPLQSVILDRVERGKEGALAVLRGSGGDLVLQAARKTLPIMELRVQLMAGGTCYAWTHEDFRGMLLVDDHGEYGREARLAVVDAGGRPIVSSDTGDLLGRVMVVAQGAGRDSKAVPVTAVALFSIQDGKDGRSALLVDASEEFLYFADLDRELAQGGNHHGLE